MLIVIIYRLATIYITLLGCAAASLEYLIKLLIMIWIFIDYLN